MRNIDNLKEILSRGCDYTGTQEVVNDLVSKILKRLGSNCIYGDEIGLINYDGEFSNLEKFANLFWDESISIFLNVIMSEEE